MLELARRGQSVLQARGRGLSVGMDGAETRKGCWELETRCGVGQMETGPQRSWQVEAIGWGTMAEIKM